MIHEIPFMHLSSPTMSEGTHWSTSWYLVYPSVTKGTTQIPECSGYLDLCQSNRLMERGLSFLCSTDKGNYECDYSTGDDIMGECQWWWQANAQEDNDDKPMPKRMTMGMTMSKKMMTTMMMLWKISRPATEECCALCWHSECVLSPFKDWQPRMMMIWIIIIVHLLINPPQNNLYCEMLRLGTNKPIIYNFIIQTIIIHYSVLGGWYSYEFVVFLLIVLPLTRWRWCWRRRKTWASAAYASWNVLLWLACNSRTISNVFAKKINTS